MKTLSCILSVLFCFSAYAQKGMVVDQKTGKITYSGIGTVSFVKGKVYRTKTKDKTSEEVGVDFPILEKDIIQTESKSIIKILMNDSTIITLGPNSHFNFKNYKSKSKNDRTASYDLKMGKARVEVPVKVAKGKLNFNTRTVSLGVRGTEFLMHQEIDKDGNSREQIALLQGKLEVKREGEKLKIMEAGDHYILKKNSVDNKILDNMIKLDQKFFDYLKADSVSQNTPKPFLSDLNDEILKDAQAASKEKATKSDDSNTFKKVKNFWEKSLEKLNKKLNKNNE